MSRSFHIDLGNGRQPTAAGWVVIILATLVTAGVGLSFLTWGQTLMGVEDPFLGVGIAIAAGLVTWLLGSALLRMMRIAFARTSAQRVDSAANSP